MFIQLSKERYTGRRSLHDITCNLLMGDNMFREEVEGRWEENSQKVNTNLWGIVLAGGDGNRLKDFTTKIYGYHRPKQYCKIVHSKSLLKLTRDRALKIIPNEKLVTIINHQHLHFAEEEIGEISPETIVVQPKNKETCAGILLPLLKIYDQDPTSTVAILPSDHFVYPEDRFMEYVNVASLFVERNPEAIAMLGVVPDSSESGYGWIERGDEIYKNEGKYIYKVLKFWEKPSHQTTELLFASGCYLNTFVLVGKSEAFIKYIRLYAPEIYNPFGKIRFNLNKQNELLILDEIYNEIPAVNFSSFVLEKIPQHLHVLEVPDVYWSDWGEEQRILRDNEKFGLGIEEIFPYEKEIQNVVTLKGRNVPYNKKIFVTAR